jgi:hypothetical protein
MKPLYYIICLVLGSFERWQNNRRVGFKQYSTRFKRFKTNKRQKNDTYNELQLITKKG